MLLLMLGGRGQLPARGSHRSGHAQLGHPAPRTMALLLNGTHCVRLAQGGEDTDRTSTSRAAPTGLSPVRPRTAPPSLHPHPLPRPCVFAGNASRIHTESMWCASVVRVSFGSLRASSAILRCRVEMTSRPNVPVICPSASSIVRSAASLRRVLWGEFPDLAGTISRLRLLAPRRASLRFLRSALPPLRPPSLPRGQALPPGPGPLSTAAPAPPLHDGEDETSQVPGRPLRTCPALRPRRTAEPRPLQDRRCGLPST